MTGFSETYRRLTRLSSGFRVREEEEFRVPEKTVRCIWNDQMFNTRRLRTVDNEELEIMFPGFWNFGPGPDFSRALIRVGNQTLEGDVELHVYGSDWKSHGHSSDPNYDRVILHAYLWRDKKQATGRSVPPAAKTAPRQRPHVYEFEMRPFLSRGLLELTGQLDFDSYPVLNTFNHGACHERIARLSKTRLKSLLQAAGDARILVKMDRFHDRIITRGYEQTAYEGVAEALGYPGNKPVFRALAERLPLAALQEVLPRRLSDGERIAHLEALLFGTAGLAWRVFGNTASRTADEARLRFADHARLWEHYRRSIPAERIIHSSAWKLSGARPANSPLRRIAGLARLLTRHWPGGMFADFLEHLLPGKRAANGKSYSLPLNRAKSALNFFCVEADGYWADHYVPGGKKTSGAGKLIGPDRSAAIAVNIHLPIGLIHARAGKSPDMENSLGAFYLAAQPAGENGLVRFMKQYVLGNRAELTGLIVSERDQQGLIQIHQDYCSQTEKHCHRCTFPDVLREFASTGEPDLAESNGART